METPVSVLSPSLFCIMIEICICKCTHSVLTQNDGYPTIILQHQSIQDKMIRQHKIRFNAHTLSSVFYHASSIGLEITVLDTLGQKKVS